MARKTKAGKRRANPLARTPGIRRPRISFDGQTITSTLFTDHSLGAANLVTDWQSLDCSAGEGINRAGADVIKHYQDYRYTQAMVEWLPKIGPSSVDAGVRVSLAYIDNPELINAYKAAGAATRVTICRNAANCKTFNLWERYVFRVPLTYRRKWFNVNTVIGSATNNEETDRSIQGIVCCVIEGIVSSAGPAAGTLGQYRCTSTTALQGFTATSLT